MFRTLVRWNFVVAVWLTVALCVAILVTLDPSALVPPQTAARAATGVAVLAFFEVALWFAYFRHEQGRVAAAAIGIGLLQPVIAATLLPQVNGEPMNVVTIQLYGYLSASHLAWALAVKPIWPKKATDF